MSRISYQAVIFDLDGTLYQMSPLFKLILTTRLLGSVCILRHLKAAREFMRTHDCETASAFQVAFYRRLGLLSGVSAQKAQHWYEQKFQPAFIDTLKKKANARPGCSELLCALKQKGLKLAVLSDYGFIAERLQALSLDTELFDSLYSADQSGALKPSVRPFHKMLGQLSCEADKCIVIGDRQDSDGEGARQHGMTFIGVADNDSISEDFMPWQRVIQRLHELTAAYE